jgi:hypothetical protein
MEAVKQFQARFDAVHKFRHNLPDNEPEIDAFDKLLNDFAFRRNGCTPTFEGPFFDWCAACFERSEIGHPDMHRPEGANVIAVIDGEIPPEWFFAALERYAQAIQDVLNTSAPASFSYHGFQIVNEDRMGEQRCRRLLAGVDYLVGTFKRKGMSKLLENSVSKVELVPGNLFSGENAAGTYNPSTKTIALSSEIVFQFGARFLQNWINEVFLHEFGHYVHLNYLSPEAKEVWDEPWIEIEKRREALTRALGTISVKERFKYFGVLKESGWDLKRAVAKLKDPVDKIKFGVWLRKPDVNEAFITPKQFRWSERGKDMANFWTNPSEYIWNNYQIGELGDGYGRKLQELTERKQKQLGLKHSYVVPIPQAIVEELKKSDQVFGKAINEVLEPLQVVSGYGKTNTKEDFAESFTAFIGAPDKLTPMAKSRMERALWLSGWHGKPVMRLAHRVLTRFQQEQRLASCR